MLRWAAHILIAVLTISALPHAGFAERRVALVVGNSAYPEAPLTNPKNDATDVADALKRLGFDVIRSLDLTTPEFDRAIDGFTAAAKDADVAFFFFSGHGLQIDKRGYLVPADFKAQSESNAFRHLVAIQDLVSRIENAAKISIVVLDACRDSPLQQEMRRIAVEKTKGVNPGKGLPAFSVTGSNTLVVFATAPGDVASDGQGRNSPFTASLLKHIETPGLEFEQMLKRVTADVMTSTQGRQQPERLSRLQTEIVLASEPDCDKQVSFACVKQKRVRGFVITDLSSVACPKEVIYKASDPALKWKAIWTTSVYSYKEEGKGPGGGLYNELLKVGGWGDYYYSLIQFEPEIASPPKFAGLFLYAKSSRGQPVSMYLDRILAPWSWEKGDRLWWKDKPNTIPHYGGQLPPPEPGKWYLIEVTGLYKWWGDTNQPNYGIQLRPTASWNQFNFFASGLEPNEALRPRLLLCY